MSSSESRDFPSDPILLENSEHTKAKHRILAEYLKGWLGVIGQTSGRMVYLDGFAGPGLYTDGNIGSPIIAVDTLNNHTLLSKMKGETVFLFTEIDQRRCNHLKELMQERYGAWDSESETFANLPKTQKFGITCGDFFKIADELLTRLEKEGSNLAPTLAFIDPFGYTIDLGILSRILRFERCELLVTYMAGFIDRFASEKLHRQSIMNTLNLSEGELEKIAKTPNEEERHLHWLRLLNDSISVGTQKYFQEKKPIYSLYFRMLDKNNRTLYYLAYFTKSEKGIEVMKHAMRKAGQEWSYRFSDHDFDPGQSSILDYTNERPWVREQAEAIAKRFAGQKVLVDQVERWVLLETIWLLSRRGSLKMLMDEGRVKVVQGAKKAGSAPPGSVLQFS